MLYYMFVFGHSSYITISPTQKTSFSEAYSNADVHTDSVNNIA